MSEYLKKRQQFIFDGRPIPEKKAYQIRPVSPKRQEKLNLQAKEKEGDTMKKFFEAARKRMIGVCQCGCGRKSSKDDDLNYRASICHVFPKAIFRSVATHPLNWIERNFWDGCHSNLDNQSIAKWANMADFEDIKERFHTLAPLLTDEERAHKFYRNLKKLIYKN